MWTTEPSAPPFHGDKSAHAGERPHASVCDTVCDTVCDSMCTNVRTASVCTSVFTDVYASGTCATIDIRRRKKRGNRGPEIRTECENEVKKKMREGVPERAEGFSSYHPPRNAGKWPETRTKYTKECEEMDRNTSKKYGKIPEKRTRSAKECGEWPVFRTNNCERTAPSNSGIMTEIRRNMRRKCSK